MAVPIFTNPLTQTLSINGIEVYSPVTSGNYYLRAKPFNSNTYTLTHIGSGVWSANNIEDNIYQIWNSSSWVNKYGTFYISDDAPTLTGLQVNGNVTLSASQFNIDGNSSTNFNNGDISHVDNLQVHSLSENQAGKGVKVQGITIRNTFGTSFIGCTSGINQWTFANVFNNRPECIDGNPISLANDTVLTTKDDVYQLVLEQIGLIASTSGNYQEAPNVVRLIPSGYGIENVVYTSWLGAFEKAQSWVNTGSSSANRTFTIEVTGENNNGEPLINSATATFTRGVFYVGKDKHIRMTIEDDTHAVNIGKAGAKNLTWYRDDGNEGSPILQGLIFDDCVFDVNVSSITFNQCIFRGTNIMKMRNTSILSVTNCSGTQYYTTKAPSETGSTNPTYILNQYIS